MAAIQILPEPLVNQIAAGEVIERPASVVKELLENAVDAQASRIIVELEEAGRKLIRISDNGCGIPAAEAPLALATHATSKLRTVDDLEAVTTLGFRGEALASIASVADVRLVTRTANALEATEVTAGAGHIAPPRPTSGPVGTSIEVRNLFRYVPARRKVLKTDATEMGHVTEQITRLALAYPAVHFSVTHGGRTVYELPPTDSLRSRIAVFFGTEVAEGLLEVSSEEPAGRLWGFVGRPEIARSSAGAQYLFLNGRYVRDRSLLHALREAYRGLLEVRRQPVAFLFLAVPPDRADVNVHPTKIEVRLRDAHLLYGQTLATVRERLLGPGLTPHLAPPAPAAPAETPSPQPAADPLREDRVRQAVADFLRSPPPQAQGHLNLHAAAPRPAAPAAPPSAPRAVPASPPPAPAPSAAPPPDLAAAPRNDAPPSDKPPPPLRAIQVHNTYLVAETPDGLLIVDQHALHERVLFEELMRRLEAGPLEGQRLLVPVTVDLADREMAAVETHDDALRRLGIAVEPLGPRTVGIHAFPLLLGKADPEATLRDFLTWAIACDRPPTARQVLEKLAHVAACRAAVKAGDPLKAEEMAAILAHRDSARLAATCPHGRPTALLLSKRDLERQFGRDYAAPSGGRRDEDDLPF